MTQQSYEFFINYKEPLVFNLFCSTDLPNPEVVTEVIGLEIPGEPYNLTCIVTVVDRLIVSPVIEWSKESVIGEENDISVYPMRYNDQLSLEFEVLNTSDAGEYTCDATITVTEISVTVTNSSVEVLKLQSEHIYTCCPFLSTQKIVELFSAYSPQGHPYEHCKNEWAILTLIWLQEFQFLPRLYKSMLLS